MAPMAEWFAPVWFAPVRQEAAPIGHGRSHVTLRQQCMS